MKRDRVLVHKLLKFVEDKGSRMFKGAFKIDGYEREQVIHHLYLCVSAGFIELGENTIADKGALVLTWKGCDYLDHLEGRKT